MKVKGSSETMVGERSQGDKSSDAKRSGGERTRRITMRLDGKQGSSGAEAEQGDSCCD